MAVISFQHNFIFIKTTKTAGTSVEVELSRRIEPEAIVTPVIPEVEGHEPRNYRRGVLRKPYFNHMPATLIRKFIGRGRFETMYRFCVEREPVAKCISHFHMLMNSPDHRGPDDKSLTWDAYCERGEFPIDLVKYAEWTDGCWKALVHDVLPYETIGDALRTVLARNGMMPFDLEARAKAEYSARRFITKDEVTPAQRALIYAAFADSIRVAGLENIYRL
jgi:hypothetical protein